ncbi:MAG: polysaccharide biosynthesis protein [Oscillospiraceae bacterium]|nr:polysaccharide biosynthesis protein [Oscillospiraceae bacterium]
MKKYLKTARLVAFDLLTCVACIALATLIYYDLNPYYAGQLLVDAISYKYYIALFGFTILFGVIFGTYRTIYVNITFRDILRQSSVVFFASVFTYVLHLFVDIGVFSGSITCLFAILFMVVSLLVRSFSRLMTVMSSSRNGGGEVRRVIIIGAGNAGSMLTNMLINRRDMGIYPVGLLDSDKNKHGMTISGVKVYGDLSKIEKIATLRRATEIIIAIPSATPAQMKEIYDSCKVTGLSVSTFGSLMEFREFMEGSHKNLKKVTIEDLLFRDSVKPDMTRVSEYLKGKRILVTGGAGSIGSEVCRQVLEYGCEYLVVMDINENGLFFLQNELAEKYGTQRFCTRVGSIRDKDRLCELFEKYKFDMVLHAAAHKHVPLMEENPFEAVKNNVFGTKNVIECCVEYKVKKFVLISTDKAVNPTNIMGATKRVAELLVQHYNGHGGCEMSAVRFGNVLGSNGSVIPIFRRQIEAGGPVTVTHRDIKRYFMTIPEAVSLVLNAGEAASGGEIFVLDMGEPVNIYDLACSMIELAGLKVDRDIKIEITGLRPGEKMFEELKLQDESHTRTNHDKIFIMHTKSDVEALPEKLGKMSELLSGNSTEKRLREAVFETISMDFEECAKNGADVNSFSSLK